MNKKDRDAMDKMIKTAWNYNNAFCRKLKYNIGIHFKYDKWVVKRCEDPYWNEAIGDER